MSKRMDGNLEKLMRRSSAFTLYIVSKAPFRVREWHPTSLSYPSDWSTSTREGWDAAEERRKRREERNRRNEARQGR